MYPSKTRPQNGRDHSGTIKLKRISTFFHFYSFKIFRDGRKGSAFVSYPVLQGIGILYRKLYSKGEIKSA